MVVDVGCRWGGGAGAAGSAVIDVGPIGRIGILNYFEFIMVDVSMLFQPMPRRHRRFSFYQDVF